MTDYIKREDALMAMQSFIYADRNEEVKAYETFENLPPADVAPVVHGQWIKDDSNICSVCGWEHIVGDGEYTYCPHCGTRMDGGKHD